MSEAFFTQHRPKPAPKTTGALLLTVVIVAGLSIASLLANYPGKVTLWHSVSLASILIAAVATAVLYFVVGRKSGDRGGTRDFFIMLFTAVFVPILVSTALTGASVMIEGFGWSASREAWEHYVQASAADRRAMNVDLERLDPTKMLTPAALSKDPGFRKARAGLEEGRAMVARYRALELQRQGEGRAILGKLRNPANRTIALREYDEELAIRRPAEDVVWDLTSDIYVKSEAILDVLQRTRPDMSRGKFTFRSQAHLDAYQSATTAFNTVLEQQQRQDRSNIEWERGRNR
jgi:hypothetical protein